MIATNDYESWHKMWAYKDHGKNYDKVYHKQHPIGFRWLHESFGTNLRMTEMQAAIGRIQLRKLNTWIELRRRNAAILTEGLSKISALRIAIPDFQYGHVYYMYHAFVIPDKLKSNGGDLILEAINAENIPCRVGSCSEIYLEQAFQIAKLNPSSRLPIARELGETSLMFQVHPTLTTEEMYEVVSVIEKVFAKAIK